MKKKPNKKIKKLTAKDICRQVMSDDDEKHCSLGWLEVCVPPRSYQKAKYDFAMYLREKGHARDVAKYTDDPFCLITEWNDNTNIKKAVIAKRLNEFLEKFK